MSRITKEISKQVALKLLEKKKESLIFFKKKLDDYFTLLVESKTPKDVLSVFENNRNYFKTQDNFYVKYNGSNYCFLDTNRLLPCDRNKCFEFTQKEIEKLLALKQRYDDASEEYSSSLLKIEIALINLKTYNNVFKELPEAYPFLPQKMSDKLAVNIQDIRELLK
jgi:hypothetical protein